MYTLPIRKRECLRVNYPQHLIRMQVADIIGRRIASAISGLHTSHPVPVRTDVAHLRPRQHLTSVPPDKAHQTIGQLAAAFQEIVGAVYMQHIYQGVYVCGRLPFNTGIQRGDI